MNALVTTPQKQKLKPPSQLLMSESREEGVQCWHETLGLLAEPNPRQDGETTARPEDWLSLAHSCNDQQSSIVYQALSKEVLLHKPLKETDEEGRQLSAKAMLHTLARTHTHGHVHHRERERGRMSRRGGEEDGWEGDDEGCLS